MKKIVFIIFLACVFIVNNAYPESLLARQDFMVNSAWQPPQVMGKDFWHVLDFNMPEEYLSQELRSEPLLKESGIHYKALDMDTQDLSKPVSIFDIVPYGTGITPDEFLNLIGSYNQMIPFFISIDRTRPPYLLLRDYQHDKAGYDQWKSNHLNFMGFVQLEWDNEFITLGPLTGKIYTGVSTYTYLTETLGIEDSVAKEIIEKLPTPTTREEATSLLKTIADAVRSYYFNDPKKMSYLRAGWCFDHYGLEFGSDMAWLEVTNTGVMDGDSYRHQVSLFFTRGASHQYGKKWGWYQATFYNGFDEQGNFGTTYPISNNLFSYDYTPDTPNYGMSHSLFMRDLYLSYLSGASFVEQENWGTTFLQNKDGNLSNDTLVFSAFGDILKNWYAFTKENPNRGISYAPVVLLVPFTQGYPQFGGYSWSKFNYERPDSMIDAFMFTLVPPSPVSKTGNEGALINSPYGDIYDVIMPDPPSGPVSPQVLNNYKAAILLGKFPKSFDLAARLIAYVKNGGTLFINIQQLNEYFDPSFLGFNRTGIKASTTGPIRWIQGNESGFTLTEAYEFEKIKLINALPLLADANNNILATLNPYGKGRVIVTMADYWLPNRMLTFHDVQDTRNVQGFPLISAMLARIVKEALPLEVQGDVQYGVNKLENGWLVYLINNKGVTKYIHTPEVIDPSKAAQVNIILKNAKAVKVTSLKVISETPLSESQEVLVDGKNRSFSVTVPPGDLRIVRILNQ